MTSATVFGSDLHTLLIPRIEALRTFVAGKIPPRFRQLISADEILQEVWIAAARTYRGDTLQTPELLDRWLRTIATSKLINALRAARQLKRGGDRQPLLDSQHRLTSCAGLFADLQAPARSPSRAVHAAEAGHTVLILLHSLAEDHCRALTMRYIDGLSYKEIADTLGKTEAGVNSLVYRARLELRRRLGSASRYFTDARTATGDDQVAQP